jgi:hypothetical protein
MTNHLLKIAGGMIYDPAIGVDGQTDDLLIDAGTIVKAFAFTSPPALIEVIARQTSGRQPSFSA